MSRVPTAVCFLSLLFPVVTGAAPAQSAAWKKATEQYDRDADSDDDKARKAAILGLAGPCDAAILSFLETPMRDWARFLEIYDKKRQTLIGQIERKRTDLEGKDEGLKRKAERDVNRLEEEKKKVEGQIARMKGDRTAAAEALARVGSSLKGGAQADYLKRIQHFAFKHEEWFVRVAYVEVLSQVMAPGVLDFLLDRIEQSHAELDRLAGVRKKKARTLDKALEKFSKRGDRSSYDKMTKAHTDTHKVTDREHGERRILDLAREGVARQIRALEGSTRTRALDGLVDLVGRARTSEVRAGYVSVLAGVGGPEALARIQAYSQKSATEAGDRIAAAQALGRLRDTESIPLLLTYLEAPQWAVRAAAVEALHAIGDRSVVEPLIAQLDREKGRLLDDIEAALEALTGQRYGAHAALWKSWFARNGKTFKVLSGKGGDAADPQKKKAGEDESSFYGIVTRSKNIVYVLDVSGSMNEEAAGDMSKIAKAKEELLQAVASLKGKAQFNVVFYAFNVHRWQKKMVKSGAGSTRKLTSTLKTMKASGGTNTHGGLMDALALAGAGGHDAKYKTHVDTIYFLSDGHPTVGAVLDPARIREEVQSLNRLRRITIHTVGVGKEHNIDFMRKLAEENGGTYAAR